MKTLELTTLGVVELSSAELLQNGGFGLNQIIGDGSLIRWIVDEFLGGIISGFDEGREDEQQKRDNLIYA